MSFTIRQGRKVKPDQTEIQTTIQMASEARGGFQKNKINKLIHHWPNLAKRKKIYNRKLYKKKAQTNKIRDEKENATRDNTEIKWIIRDYYKHPQANNLETLEEIDCWTRAIYQN